MSRRCTVCKAKYGVGCAAMGHPDDSEPARAEAPMCYRTTCRYYGQRHATPHEPRDEAPETCPVRSQSADDAFQLCVAVGEHKEHKFEAPQGETVEEFGFCKIGSNGELVACDGYGNELAQAAAQPETGGDEARVRSIFDRVIMEHKIKYLGEAHAAINDAIRQARAAENEAVRRLLVQHCECTEHPERAIVCAACRVLYDLNARRGRKP